MSETINNTEKYNLTQRNFNKDSQINLENANYDSSKERITRYMNYI